MHTFSKLTLLWTSLIGFIFTLLINIYFDWSLFTRNDTDHPFAMILGRTLGNFTVFFFIMFVIGFIINLILKNKNGYWIGLIISMLILIWIRAA